MRKTDSNRKGRESRQPGREAKEDRAHAFGRYFEDFRKGDVYLHWPGKTITESDNNLFCLLTMNHHPVHLDAAYASRAQHGRILIVGTYVFSLVVGLTVRDISGRAIANLSYQEVAHLQPVFVGDTIYARSVVLGVSPSRSRPDRGTIFVETVGLRSDSEPVLSFRRKVLVPRREEP